MEETDVGLLDRALPLDPGNEFDLDIPPTSGMEYLKRVHLEAKNCPDIVVAEVDPSKFSVQTINVPTSNGCQPCPQGYAPPIAWQQSQVADFSEMRQRLTKYKLLQSSPKTKYNLADPNDAEGWCRLCFGRLTVKRSNSEPKTDPSVTAAEPDCDQTNPSTFNYEGPTPPYLSIITRMAQPTVEKVLSYHIQWFEATGFSKGQGQWFYALLTSLEKPLTPEACALLRRLARNCCSLRASLEHADHAFVSQLNLLICLVGRYFDQTDLADTG